MYLLADGGIAEIMDHRSFIPVFVVGGAFLVAIVGIVFGTISSMVIGRAREQTKRELAAYVAEGTVDPDHAIALANAGNSAKCGKC